MDYQFWTPLTVSLILGVISLLQLIFTYQQCQLQKAQLLSISGKKGKTIVPASSPWRSYGLVGLTVLLAATSWIPFFLDVNFIEPIILQNSVVGWGMPLGVNSNTTGMVVDGLKLTRYSSQYRIAGVAFHASGLKDGFDVNSLQKSSLYDIIEGQTRVIIQLDKQFLDELHSGVSGTNYVLVLLPKSINMNQFSTLHEAKALGAKIGATQFTNP